MYYERPNLGTWRIYKITCKTTRLSYIGQTSTKVKIRFEEHKQAALNGSNLQIHVAMREEGIENFYVETLEDGILTEKEADEKERYYIWKYDTFKNGYNMTIGGHGIYVLDENDINKIHTNYVNGVLLAWIAGGHNMSIFELIKHLEFYGLWHGYHPDKKAGIPTLWNIDPDCYDHNDDEDQ